MYGVAVPISPTRSSAGCGRPRRSIGGGHDDVVLGLNRRAQAWLNCENDAFTQVLAAGIELRLVVRDESSAGY
jgi:hypothetical protein